MKIEEYKDYRHGLGKFGDYLRYLVSSYPDAELLELGGGRRPSFRLSEMPGNIGSYTVNDLSDAELSFLGPEYRKARFDVAGDVSAFENTYDVIFSRFLAEHVADGQAMHRNVYRLLRPGGVAFHLIPTLYASPFVANILLPEKLTSRLLIKYFPYRASASPKFHAHYSYCYGGSSSKMKNMLKNVGYTGIQIRNFYGHVYYDKIPVLRDIEHFISAMASRNSAIPYSSYAYLILRK
ncbi:MAG: hypothetical protein JWO83_3566 [Caulobacteraceae bacterium]|nr:hypothetical protein [Caulobacteraceae bacterium]